MTSNAKSSSDILYQYRQEILDLWLKEVKATIILARDEADPVLIDTLPVFILHLSKALSDDDPRQTANEGSNVAQEHGGERARVTSLQPEDIIREYQILRRVVLRFLFERQALKHEDTSIILQSIDEAINEALTAFFLVHSGMKEQITSTLTHDLRTPLTAIIALSQMIARTKDDHAKQVMFAERIEQNAKRMNKMIEDLLDASRIRAGEKIHIEVAEVELLTLMQEVLAEMNLIHGDRFVFEGQEIKGYWHAHSIKRAVENLCSNAIKYGDRTAPVEVKIEAANGRTLISVHNEGPQIPVEEREYLFQAFRRSYKTGAAQEGWGLGLAYVRSAAEAHGGSVGIDAAAERGTTFVIDILQDTRDLDRLNFSGLRES